MRNRPNPSALARSHAHGLTLAQQSAVDLLAAGKTDTETAAALGVNRVTVTRWRLYDVEFAAALAERRAHVWGSAADKLRGLIPAALDVLADDLNTATGAERREVALAVLKLAGPLPLAPTGPTDPEDVIRETVDRERVALRRTAAEEGLDRLRGLPSYDRHRDAVRDRFAARASEPAGCDDPTPTLDAAAGVG